MHRDLVGFDGFAGHHMVVTGAGQSRGEPRSLMVWSQLSGVAVPSISLCLPRAIGCSARSEAVPGNGIVWGFLSR